MIAESERNTLFSLMSDFQRLPETVILQPECHLELQRSGELFYPAGIIRSIEFRSYRTAFLVFFNIADTPGLCPVQAVNMVTSRPILLELIGCAFELELPLADASGWNQERHAEMIRLLKVIG
ncbi:hypothetical protein D3C75_578400 [compost metagenome]